MRDTYGRTVVDQLAAHIPLVVLTGGPCSGKSSFLKYLRRRYGKLIVVAHELATDLHRRGHRFPTTPELRVHYDCVLAEKQATLEAMALVTALDIGARVVICDRGIVDKAAYMENGVRDFEQRLRTTREAELMRYRRVLLFDIPPEEVYLASMAGNRSRREQEYALAVEQHEKTFRVWLGHPHLRIVGNAPTWAEKRASALAQIQDLL